MQANKPKKPRKTMDELAAGIKKFQEGKELNSNGKQLFDKAIKKAANKRSSAK